MVLLEFRGSTHAIHVVEESIFGDGLLGNHCICKGQLSERASVGHSTSFDQSFVQYQGNKEEDEDVACKEAEVACKETEVANEDMENEKVELEVQCDMAGRLRVEVDDRQVDIGQACNYSSLSMVNESDTNLAAQNVGGTTLIQYTDSKELLGGFLGAGMGYEGSEPVEITADAGSVCSFLMCCCLFYSGKPVE
ncbi:hypothetical protein LOK49_LG02G01307 [Camellia lanceoleosa]|uniref:Uncharacterized protein n=1 Tax=Camellia lanceoleosa TaxID=1840588 RepID=A0ACC0IUT9_9ERIC|nr:hypothetical protein LOK49_LG02G01307 [Camellia lanceoleosa]